MVKATTKKQSKKSINKALYKKKIFLIFGVSVFAIFILFLSYSSYQLYLDRIDSAKFFNLKQDMQTLQTEFNKIDSGWTYSEGCDGPHYVYDTGESYCTISLKAGPTMNVNSSNIDLYISTIKTKLSIKDTIKKMPSIQKPSSSSFGFKETNFTSAGGCLLYLDDINNSDTALSCTYQSRYFYFQRSDK